MIKITIDRMDAGDYKTIDEAMERVKIAMSEHGHLKGVRIWSGALCVWSGERMI